MTKQVFYFVFILSCCSPAYSDDDWESTDNEHVLDFTFNPILKPTELFEWLVADPTVITIGNEIHMFANEVFHGILHFTANPASPTNFTKQDTIIPFPGSVRPYAHLEEDTLYLFFEQYQLPLFRTSHIMLRKAKVFIDLSGHAVLDWEKSSITILVPELEWEKIGTQRVGNPFVFYSSLQFEYQMYYSASSIHLDDSNIDEPIYLGLARSNSLMGPWERVTNDPIPVDETGLLGKEVLGIGSLKLVKSKNTNSNSTQFIALCNRITRDSSDYSTGSTIYDSFADSTDHLYFLVYYNGRDNWRQAVE